MNDPCAGPTIPSVRAGSFHFVGVITEVSQPRRATAEPRWAMRRSVEVRGTCWIAPLGPPSTLDDTVFVVAAHRAQHLQAHLLGRSRGKRVRRRAPREQRLHPRCSCARSLLADQLHPPDLTGVARPSTEARSRVDRAAEQTERAPLRGGIPSARAATL